MSPTPGAWSTSCETRPPMRGPAAGRRAGNEIPLFVGRVVLLTRLWQNAIGAAASSYPRERLFQPLGMTSAVLEADETGGFLGEGYLYASARDWARFGEFLRLDGGLERPADPAAGFR